MIVFENFVISGTISQANHIHGRLIEEPSEFDHDEVEELARPCLTMLNRLTYEVTEIALDFAEALIWSFNHVKLAVITDSSAYLPGSLLESENLSSWIFGRD